MPLDGLFILDASRRPILQSTTALLYDQVSVPYNDIHLVCGISPPTDPLLGIAFLNAFIDILKTYFGEGVNAIALQDHFDTVYQLIAESLDAGHPLTTSPNALRESITPPSLLNSLLGSNLTAANAPKPFSSPIPWRRAGVRHTNNEIYFDIVENLKCLVSRNGTTLSSIVIGRIDVDSRLSGVPDCLLMFGNPAVIAQPAFHPCIRLARWASQKSLSFVPPDGKFVLADYETTQAPPVPITLKVDANSGQLSLTLTSRMTTHSMEKVLVEIPFGGPVNGLRGSGSPWTWDAKSSVLRFEIAQLSPSARYNLKAEWNPDSSPSLTHVVLIRFSIPSHTYSSLRVSKFTVSEEYTPFKGVRGRSQGSVEWRW
ncbi:clathrin adaptor, mu subunit [Cylindrobasidium torrendii FP15055 ss-10]|uniref:Clathrin adaptor, mu subunit n=1 Tax=Cylindrobasidium torrendii FP15055 ss-10 TaxID=1314674 RepID=A0A0D7BQP1_9AGAR|nr:clathrin adaptor, mu subunit [Cylindrobasidium torrendii FP15055 ss-10]